MRNLDDITPCRAAIAAGGSSQVLRGLAFLCAGLAVMMAFSVQGHGGASHASLENGETGVCVPQAVLLAEKQQRARHWQRALVAMQPAILPVGLVLSVSAGSTAGAGAGAQS